jgi:DNA-binding NarL/FixJ family response regulator
MSPRPDSDKLGVVIVDDHPMVRERLAQLINKEADIYVCGEADNISDGFDVIQRSGARAAIVDISLKGSSGLELIKNLRCAADVPVLVLSMHDESLYAERALRAGAKGYITKHAESEKVMTAIRQVIAGDIYLEQHVATKILTKLASHNSEKSGVNLLTDRELEVFQLIGRGRTTREVGIRLGLSLTTIETYRARIKEKLGLENSNQLCHEAARWVESAQQDFPLSSSPAAESSDWRLP